MQVRAALVHIKGRLEETQVARCQAGDNGSCAADQLENWTHELLERATHTLISHTD